MTREEAKKILEGRRRHNIRYTMFRIQAGTEYDEDMPFPELVEPVKVFYIPQVRSLLKTNSVSEIWDGFSVKWDIGTDEPEVIEQRWYGWLDKQWYTFGISKLVAVKNPGSPKIKSPFEDGKTLVVTPGRFFYTKGFAEIRDGRTIPNIGKILEESGNRTAWM